jgi:hypothetical protein
MSAFRKIRHLDYTVIFARNMGGMRRFHGSFMQFPVYDELIAFPRSGGAAGLRLGQSRRGSCRRSDENRPGPSPASFLQEQ